MGTGLQIDMSSEVRLMIPLRLLQHTPDGIDALPCSATSLRESRVKTVGFRRPRDSVIHLRNYILASNFRFLLAFGVVFNLREQTFHIFL